MATAKQWVQGARPRTLSAAVAPVLVGTAAGALDGPLRIWRALAALGVSTALQIGVNFANDYSDGVRGTDRDRKGPMRLVGSGAATPESVRTAALACFGIAAVIGGLLSIVVDWRLLVLGALMLVAAVTYTGGPKPYGYSGLGEVAVLACFGFAATAGSAYVQHKHVNSAGWWGSLVTGLPAVAILLANNLRDVDTDRVAGKRTLAVRIGADRAQQLFVACFVVTAVAIVGIGLSYPEALIALGALPLAITPVNIVRQHRDPPSLIRALITTARFQLVLAVVMASGLWWAR